MEDTWFKQHSWKKLNLVFLHKHTFSSRHSLQNLIINHAKEIHLQNAKEMYKINHGHIFQNILKFKHIKMLNTLNIK